MHARVCSLCVFPVLGKDVMRWEKGQRRWKERGKGGTRKNYDHVRVHAHTCVHVCACRYTRVCMHTCTRTRVHVCACARKCTRARVTRVCACVTLYTHTCTHVDARRHVCRCTLYTCVCILYTRVHVHAHMDVHAHTQTFACARACTCTRARMHVLHTRVLVHRVRTSIVGTTDKKTASKGNH
jgi:hypothetical protein